MSGGGLRPRGGSELGDRGGRHRGEWQQEALQLLTCHASMVAAAIFSANTALCLSWESCNGELFPLLGLRYPDLTIRIGLGIVQTSAPASAGKGLFCCPAYGVYSKILSLGMRFSDKLPDNDDRMVHISPDNVAR